MKKVLVPLDGTSFAQQVLRGNTLSSFSEEHEIILLHCLDLNQVAGPPPAFLPHTFAELLKQHSKQLQKYLDQQVSHLRENGYPSTRAMLEAGSPVKTILRVAQEQGVDLILLTSHGRSGLSRLILGSVAEGVIRRSSLPVLLMPASLEKPNPEVANQAPVVGELVL